VARWFRRGLSVSGPFGCRCLTSPAMLRLHIPLIEPDVRISRIRLSDKASCVLWHAAPPVASEPFLGFVGSRQSPGPALRPALALNWGPFPQPALPGFDGTTDLSATPSGPIQALASHRLAVTRRHRAGLPVLRSVSSCTHAVATTPAEPLGNVARPALRWQPSLSPTGRPPR